MLGPYRVRKQCQTCGVMCVAESGLAASTKERQWVIEGCDHQEFKWERKEWILAKPKKESMNG